MSRHSFPGQVTRTVVATVAVAAVTLEPPAASAARPVEGYRSADNRIGCVMNQAFNRTGNAVKCGWRGSSRGLLLTSAGPARDARWSWPARQLGDLFFTARYGQTLYLYGGTAKLEGDEAVLRCVFGPSRGVLCTNGEGHTIAVTRVRSPRITP